MSYCIGKLIVNKESTKNLNYFLISEGIIKRHAKEFYTTIRYSVQNPIFESKKMLENIKEFLPLEINEGAYFYDIFEENFLVWDMQASKF